MKPLTLDEIIVAAGGKALGPLRPCSIARIAIDSRQIQPGDLFFAIQGAVHDGHDYVGEALQRGAMYAVVSRVQGIDPAVHPRLILVADTVAALGQLAAYHRRLLAATVIGVTGSNGKTTTKEMIGQVLSGTLAGRCAPRSFNNDIGVPWTLLSAQAGEDFLVVEIGTSAPGEIHHLASLVRPDIAVITSIGPAHLEKLGSLDGVADEKLSLVHHLCDGGLAVLNVDSPHIRARLSGLPHHTRVTFSPTGEAGDADLRVTALRCAGQALHFTVNGRYDFMLPLLGRHNAGNALAAIAVGRRCGLTMEQIAGRLAEFQAPDMRLQVQQHGSLMVINDAYNANPASTRGAIDVLQSMPVAGRRVAVIGDMRELGPEAARWHREIGQMIAASDIDVLVAVGAHADGLCDAARGGSRRIQLHAAPDVERLTDAFPRLLQPGDTILMKGSRAVRLERLLEGLPNGPAAPPPPGAAGRP